MNHGLQIMINSCLLHQKLVLGSTVGWLLGEEFLGG